MQFLVLGLDKDYMLEKFKLFHQKYGCVEYICTHYPIKEGDKFQDKKRIDYSKLFDELSIFEAFPIHEISPLDNQFIENFEKCYFNFFSTIDRCAVVPISVGEINSYYYSLLCFFKSFFLENNTITHIFFPATPHFPPDIVLFHVAKYFKIETIIFSRTDFDNKYLFRTDWRDKIEFLKPKEDLINNLDLTKQSNFISHSKKLNNTSLEHNFKKSSIKFRFKQFFSLLRYAKAIAKSPHLYSSFYLNKSLPVIQYLKLLYERIKLNNNLFELYNSLSHRLDLNNNFIFFPLHFQPERSSQPEASYFENQLLAIKLLSYNLPKGYLIYVKEHPRQFDNATPDLRKTHARNYNYYNQLNEIQGVKLVDLRIDSEILIKNACLVATLTGSSGWQALKMNKPVFVFGHPWYESCFGVFNISNSNDIKKAFGVIQNLNKNEIIDGVNIFIKSLEANLVDGYTGIKNPNGEEVNFQTIAEPFSEKLYNYSMNLKVSSSNKL
jgi:hypothetical protein